MSSSWRPLFSARMASSNSQVACKISSGSSAMTVMAPRIPRIGIGVSFWVTEKSETVWSRSFCIQGFCSICLSATNGNRFQEAVKIVRKEKADSS